MNPHDKFWNMAMQFSFVAQLTPGWDIEDLALHYPKASDGEQLIISFLIGVWSGPGNSSFWQKEYGIAPLSLPEVAARLDKGNRKIIADYILNPFFP